MAFQPLISVIMPAYNAGAYLAEAIESILNQTCGDFELLLLDDGSTDNTRDIALSYKDDRLRYLPNNQNLQLVATLNRGLDLARGQYIARMDADDISLPQRFEKQIRFLERHPSVGGVGTAFRTLGYAEDYDVRYDHRPEFVKMQLLFSCKIAHATVMLRHDVLKKFPLRFNAQYLHVEDFDFFYRLSRITELCSLPDVLYLRRIHPEQVCVRERPLQLETEYKLRLKIFSECFPQIFNQASVFDLFEKHFVQLEQPGTLAILREALELAQKIIQNPNPEAAEPAVLNPFLARRCWDMCTNATFPVKGLARLYSQSRFLKWFDPGSKNLIKLRIRSFLKR